MVGARGLRDLLQFSDESAESSVPSRTSLLVATRRGESQSRALYAFVSNPVAFLRRVAPRLHRLCTAGYLIEVCLGSFHSVVIQCDLLSVTL